MSGLKTGQSIAISQNGNHNHSLCSLASDALNASQVIIVSHEKELEGFVECTCRVIKEGDCSRIEVIT